MCGLRYPALRSLAALIRTRVNDLGLGGIGFDQVSDQFDQAEMPELLPCVPESRPATITLTTFFLLARHMRSDEGVVRPCVLGARLDSMNDEGAAFPNLVAGKLLPD